MRAAKPRHTNSLGARKSVKIRSPESFSAVMGSASPDFDGEIAYDEWTAAFSIVDQDGDKMISRREFTSCGGDTAIFDAIDRARTGTISFNEWCKAFDRVDKDRNLRVSSKAWATFVREANEQPVVPIDHTKMPQAATPEYLAKFGGQLDCCWNKRQIDILKQHGVTMDPIEFPSELSAVVRKLRRMFSVRLADPTFVSQMLGGREYPWDQAKSMAEFMSIPRTQGPPNIRIAKAPDTGECNVYSAKMKPLYAEYKGTGWRPVMFDGAYERSTKTIFLNPDLLEEGLPEIESTLIQLMAAYVTQSLVGTLKGDEGLYALEMMSNVHANSGIPDIFKHYTDHGFLRLQGPREKAPGFVAVDFAFCEDALIGNRIMSTSMTKPPPKAAQKKPPPQGRPLPKRQGPGRWIQRSPTQPMAAHGRDQDTAIDLASTSASGRGSSPPSSPDKARWAYGPGQRSLEPKDLRRGPSPGVAAGRARPGGL